MNEKNEMKENNDLHFSTAEPSNHNDNSQHDNNSQHNSQRKTVMLQLAAVILAAMVGCTLYYFFSARFYEKTDDAYVNGHLVQITPQIMGTVISVHADDTQRVQEGKLVIQLDSADAKIALKQAEADLAQAVRQVHTLYINNDAYQANIAQRQAELRRAKNDLHRRLILADTGAIPTEEIEHARAAVQLAQAALKVAQQQLASNLALTEQTAIDQHPTVLAAAAKVRLAYLNCARNRLPAPVSGIVAKRSVQVGQRVAPGAPLMTIVPLEAVWVEANFKEGQLKRMRIGQLATLTADAYGSSVVFHGRVAGFSAGTGSAFALLPAQNATGNWIKVVQRLPVRILLRPEELQQHPLRIGLSMQVRVDIRHYPNTPLDHFSNTTYRTQVFAQYGTQAEAEVQRIIAQNMPIAMPTIKRTH